MTVTVLDVQTVLKRLGHYTGDLDGLSGPKTAAAVVEFQKSKGITETGKVDPRTLAAMFPKEDTKPKGITATLQDWVLNYAQSKIVWVAGALVAALVTFAQTKFGFNIPPDMQLWLSTGIGSVLALLIAVIRGQGKDTPRVTSIQPAVIQRPSETVGVPK